VIPAPRTEALETDDGVRLAVHRLGDPAATPVLLLPGTFSNSSFWFGTRGTGFARKLVADGYEAWSLDMRGHGASQRPRRGQRWDFDDWARHDVTSALRRIADHGRRPVLVGHSAGGAALLAALAAHPELQPAVRGVVAVATPVPWHQRARGTMARLIRAASARLDTFPARLLRLGPEDELAGVMEQWMRWNLSGRWVGDDGTDYGDALRSLEPPSFVVAGAGDRVWAPPPACRGLYDLLGSPDKSFLFCGRRSGFTRDFGHVDIITSRAARSEVWPLLTNWIAHVA